MFVCFSIYILSLPRRYSIQLPANYAKPPVLRSVDEFLAGVREMEREEDEKGETEVARATQDEREEAVFNVEEQFSQLNKVIVEQRNEIRALKEELKGRGRGRGRKANGRRK